MVAAARLEHAGLVARAESTTAEGLVRLKAELASQLAAGLAFPDG